jgi:hypothetical protein
MNSRNLPPQHAIGSIKKTATPSDIASPEQARADSAVANDTAVTGRQNEENPIWNLVIVLMVLCGLALIVIAFS